MERGPVEVGRHYVLTVAELDVAAPPDLAHAMVQWRDQTLAAVGLVAAVLDERLALEELVEDFIVFEPSGAPIAAADHVQLERTFPPMTGFLSDHRESLETLSQLDFSEDDPRFAAARWYLKAAQLGPVADAVVFLWIALEALAKPRYGTRLTPQEQSRRDVAWVELALAETGFDVSTLVPSVGRLAGLRAQIVHGGLEQPQLLDQGYYALEWITRLLLRHCFGVTPETPAWPLSPADVNLKEPYRAVALEAMKEPRTIFWRLNAEESKPPTYPDVQSPVRF
jgi:hypothetical protein